MELKPGTKAQLQTLLREAGVDFQLGDRFYRELVLSMNGVKGRTGEFLVHASVLDLLREEDSKFADLPQTQHVLDTSSGMRRINLYFKSSQFSIEIKPDYVRRTHDFRKQVQKDVWLIENRPDLVSEVMWIFLRGATDLARRYLDEYRITWMDLDLDQMRPPVTSNWPGSNESSPTRPQIR
jgi:hypothetical protein